jgi:hypothetical protein
VSALTLQLRRVEGALHVRLLKEGQEIASASSVPDLDAGELTAVRAELTEGQNLTPGIPRLARIIGEKLLPPDVLNVWLAESQAVPNGDRLVTMIDADGELQAYPWELGRARERLFLRADRPFIRKAHAAADSLRKPAWPLDMLIVLGSSKTELQRIDGYGELQRIRDVLRERNRFVHLHVLDLSAIDERQRGATGRQRLSAALDTIKPHILHFIGHGAENGLELFQAAENEAQEAAGSTSWTDDAIRADVKFTPWLVYLNACRSLGGGQTLPAQFSTLANVFLEKGAKAVVAMHADISGPSAATCAEVFYRALAEGEALDVALTRARVAVDQSIPGSEAGVREMAEAYLPVLIVACDPREVLPCFKDRVQPPKTAQISKGNELTKVVHELVNQDAGRRALLGWPHPETAHANAIVVHGPPSSGKSWLLAWCLDGWMRQEYQVRYRTMARHSHWFDAMMGILDGDPALGPASRPLERAKEAFVAALGTLVAPADGKKRAGGKAGGAGIKPVDRRRIQMEIASVSQSFADALEQEAGKTPLVLVLDQFEMPGPTAMDPVTFQRLYTNWLQPHVIDGNGSVRVVLGLSRKLAESYELPASTLTVPLDIFPQERHLELLDELLRARYAEKYPKFRELWEKEKGTLEPSPRLPAELSNDCDIVYGMLKLKLPRGGM